MTSIYGKASAELNERIRILALDGLSIRAIATELGRSRSMVSSRISVMRKKGRVPSAVICKEGKTKRSRLVAYSIKFGRRLGTMSAAMDCMSREQVQWLFRKTPEGMSVAQYVAAIVKDVYQEDVGNDCQG